jgi:hypothetical protein
MYYDRDPATAAVDRLHNLGYGRDEISVMMDDKTRERAFSSMVNAKGSEGVAAGATIGGVLGAIVAGLTASGSVAAIAGTGGLATPLVVGPLAAALAGLGAGAARRRHSRCGPAQIQGTSRRSAARARSR